MIGIVRNLASNSTLANLAQNTSASVSIETTLKSIGRPGFILIDKDIDPDTKQYAAAKEFLYQATCLAIYLAAIVPIFKHGGFKLAKEKLFKNTNGFEHFKDVNHYLHYRKLAENSVANRQATLQKELADKTKVSELYDKTLLDELKKETPEKFADVKGAIEFSNLIGSVLGLAIIAPQLSHAFIHPALKFLGLEKKEKKEINQAKQTVDKMIKEHHKLEEKQKNIDIKA